MFPRTVSLVFHCLQVTRTHLFSLIIQLLLGIEEEIDDEQHKIRGGWRVTHNEIFTLAQFATCVDICAPLIFCLLSRHLTLGYQANTSARNHESHRSAMVYTLTVHLHCNDDPESITRLKAKLIEASRNYRKDRETVDWIVMQDVHDPRSFSIVERFETEAVGIRIPQD